MIDRLTTADSSVRLNWNELKSLVGKLPASTSRHRTWWSRDRSHVNGWRTAGFTVTELLRRRRRGTEPGELEQMQMDLRTRFSLPFVRLDSAGIQRIRSLLPSNRKIGKPRRLLPATDES